jgi:hypothetical protein
MSIKTDQRTDLLRAGYSANEAGHLETRREPDARWSATHLALIRIDAPKDFTIKVLAALDDPAAIVGVSVNGAVVLFRVDDGGRYDAATYPFFRKEERHEFVLLDGKTQCLFIVTSTAQTIDTSKFIWRDGRSPSTTHRNLLPELFLDVQQRVYDAVAALLKAEGNRFGLVVEPESVTEKWLREAREKKAAGLVDEPPTDPDEALVAANVGVSIWDGVLGQNVAMARTRIAEKREAEKREANESAERARKARLKELLAHAN